MHNNRISIITALYNGGSTLQNLIDSISYQTVKPYEFIIIDGGSTDSSISIIKKNDATITLWLSEIDNSIYDAWNKGISLATGDWIMFLGADDMLANDAIDTYLNFIENTPNAASIDYISSKVQMIDASGTPIWVNGKPWKWPYFKYKMIVAHPGSLHSKNLFQNYGLYNTNYKIVGDYELLLRAGNKLKTAFVNHITVKMTEGGTSDSWNAINEYFKATTLTGKANELIIYVIGIYVFTKSKLNRYVRHFGLKLNRDR